VATAGLASGLAATLPAAVSADVPFSGTASADGVRLSAAAPGFLLVEQFSDAGAPTAQSSAESLETVGYAGYPWPGDETFGLMGTAGGAAGVPLPDFPSSARSSSTTTPHVHKEYGPVVLDAVSTDSASRSSARAPLVTGPANAGTTKADTSVVHEPSGSVMAKAASKVEAFDLGGVLRIGGVSAEAEVTAVLGLARRIRSSLQVSDVTVAGQTVGVTEKGLVVAGTTVPLPADNPLAQVLADQEVAVTYVQAERTPDGVTSAGLRVTARRVVPGLPEPVQVSYLFGRAHAAATAGRDTSETPAVTPQPSADAVASPVSPGTSTSDGSGRAAPVPVPRAAAPAVAAPAAPSGSAPALRHVAALRVDGSWYLVLVLGGVVMTACASLLRLFGVKGLWA
jgi:hypothetical protein